MKLDVATAYSTLLPVAQSLAAFVPMAGSGVDPAVVQTNVDAGLAAIAPYRGRIAAELPAVSLDEVFETGNVARAFVFALTQVLPTKVTAAKIEEVTTELNTLRGPMLTQLEVFASPLLKLLPSAIPEKIRPGSGPRNMAEDGIVIVAAFRDPQWDFQNKHPFTDTHFARLESLSNWVLDNVKADGAPTPNARVPGDAQENADRLFTLLKRRHAVLRRVGQWLFDEDEVDARVPKLNSHAAPPRPAKLAAPTEPPVKPTT